MRINILCYSYALFLFVLFPGNYLFINSSKRPPGSKARLLSDSWRPPSGPACLQFWYYKNDIGNGLLNVYIVTKSSDSLAWSESGSIKNRWLFVQTTLHASTPFLVRLILNFLSPYPLIYLTCTVRYRSCKV